MKHIFSLLGWLLAALAALLGLLALLALRAAGAPVRASYASGRLVVRLRPGREPAERSEPPRVATPRAPKVTPQPEAQADAPRPEEQKLVGALVALGFPLVQSKATARTFRGRYGSEPLGSLVTEAAQRLTFRDEAR